MEKPRRKVWIRFVVSLPSPPPVAHRSLSLKQVLSIVPLWLWHIFLFHSWNSHRVHFFGKTQLGVKTMSCHASCWPTPAHVSQRVAYSVCQMSQISGCWPLPLLYHRHCVYSASIELSTIFAWHCDFPKSWRTQVLWPIHQKTPQWISYASKETGPFLPTWCLMQTSSCDTSCLLSRQTLHVKRKKGES